MYTRFTDKDIPPSNRYFKRGKWKAHSELTIGPDKAAREEAYP